MKTAKELKTELLRIDHKPYPAYKGLKGEYRFENFLLGIDHVQGDPFASPSGLRVELCPKETGIPDEYRDNQNKRTALSDYCLRAFGKEVKKFSFAAKGSGKSGLIEVSPCGQQVLARTACRIDADGSVKVRLHVGFPANGRSINSRELMKILFDFLPKAVEKSLVFSSLDEKEVKECLDLYEDQMDLRAICRQKGWAAFVGDGSILPRKSGVSQLPMTGAVPFSSPVSMREEVVLPHKGSMTGMAIKKGITLIVGGGYHGKSTLLYALETGIYPHIKGDGREYICSDVTGMKIRAEDGRAISGTDISMFINDLPNKKNTEEFWTEDASGSTSQAANVAEALSSGAGLLLIDEDTSATNFMVRDDLMAQIIAREKEPITPFIDRVRALYEDYDVSTILVAGSSGAYFSIADKVIQMDEYRAVDITEKVRAVFPVRKTESAKRPLIGTKKCRLKVRPMERKKGQLKAKQYGIDSFSVGKETVEIRGLEQIVDYEQTAALSHLLKYMLELMEHKAGSLREAVESTWKIYEKKGMEGILGTTELNTGFAEVRKQDFYSAANRYRGYVKIK